MDNLEFARDALLRRSGTLALYDGRELIFFTERGIKPLLDLYSQGRALSAFAAADKVVGRASAFMYVLLGVKRIYAGVISEGALRVFENSGIDGVSYGERVSAIRNRAGTGTCPMESAVTDITDPHEAYEAILRRYNELNAR